MGTAESVERYAVQATCHRSGVGAQMLGRGKLWSVQSRATQMMKCHSSGMLEKVPLQLQVSWETELSQAVQTTYWQKGLGSTHLAPKLTFYI